MRRIARRFAAVSTAAALFVSLTAGPAHAPCNDEPAYLEGWMGAAIAEPSGMFPQYSRFLEPTIDGYIVGVGYWKIVIKRGKGKKAEKIVINSPANGAPAFHPPGTTQPGDKVTGSWLHPFSWMMFGNPGCVPFPEAVAALVERGGGR